MSIIVNMFTSQHKNINLMDEKKFNFKKECAKGFDTDIFKYQFIIKFEELEFESIIDFYNFNSDITIEHWNKLRRGEDVVLDFSENNEKNIKIMSDGNMVRFSVSDRCDCKGNVDTNIPFKYCKSAFKIVVKGIEKMERMEKKYDIFLDKQEQMRIKAIIEENKEIESE